MSRRILIGGIGNVLLGDDAVGPYLIYLLESQYIFGDSVEIADLGTPALDLTHRIVGLEAVILIDCIAPCDHPPGTVLLFDKADILRVQPAQRLDPHSPALSECLMAAEMLGSTPKDVLLVGIVGECFEPGDFLSPAVEFAVESAVLAILSYLQQLGVPHEKRQSSPAPSIWWSDFPKSLPSLIKEH
ncbi:MAG TPA: hydrogenase maturation protease [Candidatus Sulfotelmatobacter sp.]|nr:hydrogenase maturation protease [Candidatus Sulfotelmatobacter sp.]